MSGHKRQAKFVIEKCKREKCDEINAAHSKIKKAKLTKKVVKK